MVGHNTGFFAYSFRLPEIYFWTRGIGRSVSSRTITQHFRPTTSRTSCSRTNAYLKDDRLDIYIANVWHPLSTVSSLDHSHFSTIDIYSQTLQSWRSTTKLGCMGWCSCALWYDTSLVTRVSCLTVPAACHVRGLTHSCRH